ncbi:MAG: DUF3391 domain-containing protein [Sphingomonadales bacterium]|nr:DUF3391 domain-containing protein [Sphingomonadales bacterium]
MLKRIETGQVEIGMFIQKLEGSWADHPFWRTRFLLDTAEQLEKLRASAVPSVIIDTARGRDVVPGGVASPEDGPDDVMIADEAQETAIAPAGPPAVLERLARRRNSAPVTPRLSPAQIHDNGKFLSAPAQSLAREFGRASAVATKSRAVVSRAFFKVRLGKAFNVSMVEPVIDDIFASIERNPHAFNGLMRCKQDNEPLYRHALATSGLMIALGRQLRLPSEVVRQAGLAGLFLDFGISKLPVDLAAVGFDHTRIEPGIMADHVELGYLFCLASGVPAEVAEAVREHHERSDGRGYPRRVRRADISQLGRMAAVCDAFDDYISGEDAAAMNPAQAIARMRADEGAYDEDVLSAFIATVGIYPVGAVLQLKSGRLAMVVDQNADDTGAPKVVPFFSTISGQRIPPQLVDLASGATSDAIDSLSTPEQFGIADFAAIRERLFATAAQSAGSG